MRFPVGKTLVVRAGDDVRVHCTLRGDVNRVSVWSAVKGFDFSPHFQHAALHVMSDQGPAMLSPMGARLHAGKPEQGFKFIADEDLLIRVMQEKDDAKEPSAKVRIYKHGKVRKIAEACGRRLRNLFRFGRNSADT